MARGFQVGLGTKVLFFLSNPGLKWINRKRGILNEQDTIRINRSPSLRRIKRWLYGFLYNFGEFVKVPNQEKELFLGIPYYPFPEYVFKTSAKIKNVEIPLLKGYKISPYISKQTQRLRKNILFPCQCHTKPCSASINFVKNIYIN